MPLTNHDETVPGGYGDPFREQRLLATGVGLVDRSHREIIAVPGRDRLSWLHDVISQHVRGLADGFGSEGLVLSPNGHVEQHFGIAELAGTTWLDTEPGSGAPLLKYLDSMRFFLRVEPRDASSELAMMSLVGPAALDVLDLPAAVDTPDGPRYAVRALDGGGWARRMADFADGVHVVDLAVPREQLPTIADTLGVPRAGLWAYEALRVASAVARQGLDTDHRTIPHEVGWIGRAVHLEKGCYRGQETVARVHNLGQPPRRLVLLHLSGESDELPALDTPVESNGRKVGRLGTAAHHHELGPIALALVKRTVSGSMPLVVAGHPVALDPDFAEPPVHVQAGRAARESLR